MAVRTAARNPGRPRSALCRRPAPGGGAAVPGGRSGERSPAGVAGHGAALCSALPGWHELQPRSCPSARGRRLRALLLGELPPRCAMGGPAGLGGPGGTPRVPILSHTAGLQSEGARAHPCACGSSQELRGATTATAQQTSPLWDPSWDLGVSPPWLCSANLPRSTKLMGDLQSGQKHPSSSTSCRCPYGGASIISPEPSPPHLNP